MTEIRVRRRVEFSLYFLIVAGPLAFGAVETWARLVLAAAALTASGFAGLGPVNAEIRRVLSAVALVVMIGSLQLANPAHIGEPSSLLPSTVSASATAKAVGFWLALAGAAWASFRWAEEPDALSRLLWCLFVTGFVVALVGIFQKAQGNQAIYGLRKVAYGYNPFGPYYNRDHAASFLAAAFLAGVGVATARLERFKPREGAMPPADFAATQTLVYAGLLVIGGALAYTGSRAGLAAFAAAGAVLGLLLAARSSGLRRAAAAAATAALPAALVLVVARNPDFFSIEGLYYSADFRLALYRSAAALIRDFPLTGIGVGAFEQAFQPYQPDMIHGLVRQAHSDWLQWPAEFGLPAGLLLVAAFLHVLWRAFFAGWQAPRAFRSTIWGGAAAGLALLLHAAVEFTLQIPANVMLLAVLIGGLSGAVSAAAAAKQPGRSP